MLPIDAPGLDASEMTAGGVDEEVAYGRVEPDLRVVPGRDYVSEKVGDIAPPKGRKL
jgi:hypothetical protein